MVGRHRRSPDTRTFRRTTLAPLGMASVAVLSAAPFANAAPAPQQAQPAQPSAHQAQPGGVLSPDDPPCSDRADICVDLSEHHAWLMNDGEATGDPMSITSGTPDDPTPTGDFTVNRKERHHVSKESGRDVPMPYSLFFDQEGRAFHTGDTARNSNGCIHLDQDDARTVFNALQEGSRVEIRR
ncbi:hypothetical protein Acsp06_46400 [Actinomycetospora sp. NBRC 106375]|uniref:L,D-transpeptidase n=1 Tax=Actinomycetospora sp. NBRC 106375 TaxID=3032207 RepID=UPI0024A47684|nr:L,D-transpeptidase [Actinomycetospora sp. NBRC 106375]GLZ48455.1 hypothetical protein Acsp06_46400 [Actinomycetospora sp. NBRC 106375]